MDKPNTENVMALAFELAETRQRFGPQHPDYRAQVIALRAEVDKLAAQAAPSEAQADLVIAVHTLASHFENTLYALRDDAEAVTKAKGDIAHALQISAKYNRNGAAAQPSQAPVVQAGEYPPLPEELFSEFWGCVAVWDLSAEGEEAGAEAIRIENVVKGLMRAYVDADRASSGATTQAVRMLTEEELTDLIASTVAALTKGQP